MKRQSTLSFVAFLLVALSMFGQQAYYGSIVGNVMDQSGAVVPRATVALTNTATGVTLSVVTNAEGIYEGLNLTPSTYTVRVSSPGFQTFVREQVSVGGGQQARVDARLTIGSTQQEILVTGASSMINTENATTTEGTITTELEFALPQPNKLAPWPDVYYQFFGTRADIYASGHSPGGALNNQMAQIDDGMRTENAVGPLGGGTLVHPSLDSVQEVVITTSNPSAKYSNPAAIELVIKSGTNNWHGTLWEVHGDKSLNAPDYYTHKKSPFVLNQYGGSLGGPIIKNKTFFFVSYQGFQFPLSESTLNSVPTVKMKSGDFSELLDPVFLQKAGYKAPVVVKDPSTGQPFPGNVIPAGMISPVAKGIVAVYPDPNFSSANPLASNYQQNDHLLRKENQVELRVDHYFSPTETLYGRYTYFDSPNGRSQSGLPGFGGDFFLDKGRIITLHFSSTLSPTLLNHAMFGFYRDHWPSGAGLFVQTPTAWNQKLGISGIPAAQDSGFPYLTFSQTGFNVPQSWGYSDLRDEKYQLQDDITWSHGKHSIQTGIDFRRDHEGSSSIPGTGASNFTTCQYGCMTFNGRWSGNDFADLLLGLPFSSTKFIQPPPDFRNRNEWQFYLQDDMKLTPRLSLSLGLRYAYFPFAKSENGLEALFVPSLKELVVPSQNGIQAIPQALLNVLPIPVVTAAAAGLPTTLLNTDKNGWQPRFGFAYRFAANTVVRGGAGVYRTPLASTGRSLLSGPFSVTQNYPSVQPGAGGSPVLSIADPYNVAGTARPLINFFAADTNLHNVLNYDFNLAVEHQIGANVFAIEYQGKTAVMPYAHELNAVPASLTPFNRNLLPFPTLGSISGLSNGAHYNFQGLRLNARRTFSRGLYFDTTYMFAKEIDSVAGINGETAGAPEDPFNLRRDRGVHSSFPIKSLSVNFQYILPFGSDSRLSFPDQARAGHVINEILKGWELGGTNIFNSGPHGTPTGSYLNALGQNYDAPNTNRLSGRPNLTGVPIAPTADQAAQGYQFNPNAFSAFVQPGNYGSAGKSIIPFPGTISVNLSLFRNFGMPKSLFRKEGSTLQFGVFMINAINHENVPAAVTNISSPLFGKPTLPKTDTPRQIALQGRIVF